MGFLQDLFSSKLNNPALRASMETYKKQSSDDHLADVWHQLLNTKVILATTPESARAVAKMKNMREAMAHTFNTLTNDFNDNFLAVYVDTERYQQAASETQANLVVRGTQAYELALAKGFMGLVLNPRTEGSIELKVWQHQIFVEKVADAMKLHALASKLGRAGYAADSEAVLKGAIFASQRDPGPNHPFTAELNIELARTLRSQNKLEQAEWAYKHALGIFESTGSSDLDVASTSEAVASLLCEMHRAPLAVPFMERALGIYERIPGGKPDSIARILCMIGDIKCDGGKQEEGESYYKRAVITLEERKHADVLGVLLKLGEICEKSDRHKEAVAHYLRVLTLFESVKRPKDIDAARAAHRTAAIHLQEDKPAEALPLLERALLLYRKEDQIEMVEAVERMMSVAKEKMEARQQEDQQSQSDPMKPAFGRSSKRPAELPLLDMSVMRSNPKAQFVESPRAESSEPTASPGDSESQALEQMRAFLDSVNKDGTATQSLLRPAPEAWTKSGHTADAGILPAETKLTKPGNPLEQQAPTETQSTSAPQAQPVEFQAAVSAEDDDAVAALFKNTVDKLPSSEPKVVPEPPKSALVPLVPLVPPVPPLTSRAATPVPPPSKATEAPAPIVSAPKETVTDSQPPPVLLPVDEQGIGKSMAADISSVFNKSVMGDASKNDRFDKQIAARNQPAAPDTTDRDRFDQPIQDRLPASQPISDKPPQDDQPETEPTPDTPEERQATQDEPVHSESVSAEPEDVKPKFDASRFDQSIQDRAQDVSAESEDTAPDESASLFSDIEDSVNDAFKNLLGESAAAADRFEIPIQARQTASDELFATPQASQAAPMDTSSELTPAIESPDTASAVQAAAPSLAPDATAEKEPAAALSVEPQHTPEPVQATTPPVEPKPAPEPVQATAPPEGGKLKTALLDTSALPRPKLDMSGIKNPEELLTLLDARLTEEPQNTDLLLRKGTALAQLQRMDEAIKVFDKVTTLSPDDLKAWYCKGSTLHLKGNFEDAIYCFNYVLKLDAENIKALMRKAECLVKLGRADQGMTLYDRVVTLEPRFVAGWLSKARAYVQQRRLGEAMTCYMTVLTIEPNNEEALKAKNLLATKLGVTAQL